jgi:hypothetical protein
MDSPRKSVVSFVLHVSMALKEKLSVAYLKKKEMRH